MEDTYLPAFEAGVKAIANFATRPQELFADGVNIAKEEIKGLLTKLAQSASPHLVDGLGGVSNPAHL